GGFHQDIYVPLQRGTFALVATIRNNGTHPVTIRSASPPQGSGLSIAGAIRYSTPGTGGSNQIPPPTSRVLRNVELAPGQGIPRSKRHNASVPVGLNPRVAPAAQVDLQELGLPPTGCAEKDLHAARVRRGHRGETGQASWLLGCRVHVGGRGVATDPGPGRPDPQLPAPRSYECRSLYAHLHAHRPSGLSSEDPGASPERTGRRSALTQAAASCLHDCSALRQALF